MPILIIQMGHVARTAGATGTTGEQAFARRVATAAGRLLNGRGGWIVRAIHADVPTDAYQGDAFVAVHCDGSTNPTAHGASVGYQGSAGQRIAQAWKRAYAARGWAGGFRSDNYTPALAGYYGVRNARSVGNTAAFIVECGFLTNPDDRAALTRPDGADRVALAIGDALGIPTGTPTPPAPNPQEDNDMPVFVRGDSNVPIPDTDNVYGDVVFKLVYEHPYPVIAGRVRVTSPNDPGFVAFQRSGGRVLQLPQAVVDTIPEMADLATHYGLYEIPEVPETP